MSDFLGGATYDAHNGLEDVRALQRLFDARRFDATLLHQHSFDLQFVAIRWVQQAGGHTGCVECELGDSTVFAKTQFSTSFPVRKSVSHLLFQPREARQRLGRGRRSRNT